MRQTKESGNYGGDNQDGRLEAWFDGVKVWDYIGNDPSRPEYQKVMMAGQLQKFYDGAGGQLGLEGPSANVGRWGSKVSQVYYGPIRFYAPN